MLSTKTKIKSIKHLNVSSCTSALQDDISTQLHSIFPDDSSHLVDVQIVALVTNQQVVKEAFICHTVALFVKVRTHCSEWRREKGRDSYD